MSLSWFWLAYGSMTAGDWVGPELAASSLSWDWVILPEGQPAAVFAGTDSDCLCRQALRGQLRRLIGYNLPGYPLVLHCEGLGHVLGELQEEMCSLAASVSGELLRGR